MRSNTGNRTGNLFSVFVVLAAGPFLCGASLHSQEALTIEEIKREKPVLFDDEILPILRTNCVACHSSTKSRGDVNLESVEAILKGGEDGPVVLPGKSAESPLMKSVAHQVKPIMPPKKNKVGAKPLTPRQLGLIALWIDQGAKSGGSGKKTLPVEWHPLPGGHNPIYAAAVRYDGKIAACARANQVFLYELGSGGLITRLTDTALVESGPYQKPGIAHHDSVQCLAFSPDGETLASGGFRCVKIWKHQKGTMLSEFDAGASPVTCMDVSHGSGVIGTGHEDGKVRIQKLSGELVVEVAAAGPVAGLSIAMAGKTFCVLTKAGVVEFWSVDGGKKTGTINLASPASSVTYLSKDTNVATGGEDGTVSVWNIPAEVAKAPDSKGDETQAEAPSPAPLKELKGHQKKITCLVSVNREGGQVVSGSEDGSLRLWDSANGKQVREFKHGSPVRSVAIGKEGSRLAASGETPGVSLWNIADGKEIGRLQGDPAMRRTTVRKERFLKLLKDRLAAHKKAREGDAKNLVGKKNAEKKTAEALAKAKKARDDKNKALEAVKGEAKKKIENAENESKAAQAALAAATKLSDEKAKALANSRDAGKKTIEAANKEMMSAKAALVSAKTFSADKVKALAEAKKGDDQGKIQQADKEAKDAQDKLAAAMKLLADKNTALGMARADSKKITDLAAKEAGDAKAKVPAAKKVSVEKNKALEVAKKGPDKKSLEKADKEAKTAQSTVDSAERTLAESGKDVKKAEDKLKERDKEIEKAGAEIAGPEKAVADAKSSESAANAPVRMVSFSPDGRYLYSLGDNKLFVTWGADTGAGLHSFSAEGRFLLSTAQGAVSCRGKNRIQHLVPAGQWALEKTLGSAVGKSPLVDRVLSIDFSPDGRFLAAGGGEASRTGELSVWDLQKGALAWRLDDAHSDTVFAVDYSAEGKYIATGGADKFARSFKAIDGERVRFYEGHTAHVLGVSWQSDTNVIASCGADNVIKIWDFRSGEVKRTIGGFSKQVTAISFIGDSQETLACSGDKTVKMHRANDGNNFRTLAGGGDYMYSVGVTADATVVVAGGYDSVLHVWNGKDGKSRYQLKPPEK